MYLTVGDVLELTVQKFPDKEALYDVKSGRRYTYQEWNEAVNQLAHAFLQEGVQKGDRISAYLFNCEELAIAYFASCKIGAVFTPINYRLMSEEIAYILQEAQPKIVLFERALSPQIKAIEQRFPKVSFWYTDLEVPAFAHSLKEKMETMPADKPVASVNENDVYALMYTSGTTGRPKGVIHRHRDMVEQSLAMIHATNVTERDRGLVTAPMFHCAELHCAFLPRVHVGASQVILHQFQPQKVLSLIQEERITTLFAAPTMWNRLLQEDLLFYDVTSLKLGLYGAAPMAPSLVRECQEKLGIQLVQAYGMTEMGPAISFLQEQEQLTKAGSAGRPCINHEIRIVKPREDGPSEPDDVAAPNETGEIIVRGPSMMAGYFHREKATEKAMYKGWYHSGDIGYFDKDGYLWVCDRVDDMIISGGENIYPREVENVLFEHPGVLDAAVIGETDEIWGEKVTAFIVKKDPALTESDLEEFCRASSHLADYKRPRAYKFVETLPRNASGKIQKFTLRQQTAIREKDEQPKE
ncbi:fatty acid--CoA ligase [Bacillus xiapuensis]|uniref:fatty acid--CoA ligase n=1 Tax=Bacillus xiapuensis TaxID=2014075 RepID=UPI000C24795B|nr:fatty acid--CoA ligase [Bacillus xiapuensis]